MGMFEAKIKEELMQSIFNDTANIYDFIENRFALDEATRQELIQRLNAFNNDLSKLLKESKLA